MNEGSQGVEDKQNTNGLFYTQAWFVTSSTSDSNSMENVLIRR